MAKKRPPCIRNLECFKEGCPQQSWNGEDGCSAWIEMTVATKENPLKPEIKKMCIDLWQFDFSVSTLGALEGNQEALETFRNGMVEIDKSTGHTRPKADPGMLVLVQMIHNQIQKLQIEDQYRMKKLLEKEESNRIVG
jgi:hypothetical protein